MAHPKILEWRPLCDKPLYPSHTEAATVLQPFLTNSREIAVRCHCSPSSSVVMLGCTSRRMVVVAILFAVRNFGMFKIPNCDFLIALHLVCCLSAPAQI